MKMEQAMPAMADLNTVCGGLGGEDYTTGNASLDDPRNQDGIGEDELLVATKNGMAIRFSESGARSLGRVSHGVRAVRRGSYRTRSDPRARAHARGDSRGSSDVFANRLDRRE